MLHNYTASFYRVMSNNETKRPLKLDKIPIIEWFHHRPARASAMTRIRHTSTGRLTAAPAPGTEYCFRFRFRVSIVASLSKSLLCCKGVWKLESSRIKA